MPRNDSTPLRFAGLAPVAMAILLVLAVAPEVALATGGELVWEQRGQPGPWGGAFAIGVLGNVVVAAGETGGLSPDLDAFVRAYDATSGDRLWGDRFGTPNVFDRSQDLAVDGVRAFASGWVFDPQHGFDLFVRAYSVDSGALLWERQVGDHAFGEGVATANGRAFVVGRLVDVSGRKDFAVLAFDGPTGTPLWQSLTDPSRGTGEARAYAVVARGDRVFVAGTVYRPDDGLLLVRAYDAPTGALLWQRQIPGAADDYDRNRALASDGDRLFVGGYALTGSRDAPEAWLVRAYDATTGATLWEDRQNLQSLSSVTALKVENGRLVAGGYDCDSSFFNCHLDVRSHDAQTGALLWQDRFNRPGGDVQAGIAAGALEVGAGEVFVGGSVLNAAGRYEWTLRAYDGGTGVLEWEDRVDGGGPAGAWSSPHHLRVEGDRLFAAGGMSNPGGTADFTIRVYALR